MRDVSHRLRERSAMSGETMENGLRILAALMSVAVLAGFVGIFGWTVLKQPTTESTNEALVYIWTSVSVLVGGVVAVAYGQPEPKPVFSYLPNAIILAYAVAYMGVGIAACVAWIAYQDKAVALIENGATTFIGLVLPIVSAFLKPKAK